MRRIFAIWFLSASIFILPFSVWAGPVINLPNPLCAAGGSCVNDIPTLITKVTQYVLTFIGALAVLVLVWAGILFLTSAGNEGQVGKARKALLWAVIGLAIALAGTGLIALVSEIIGAPIGACYDPGQTGSGTCVMSSQSACNDANGWYDGDGTSCP